ncbi:hypothetical protein FF1_010099 [Malus domestica]
MHTLPFSLPNNRRSNSQLARIQFQLQVFDHSAVSFPAKSPIQHQSPRRRKTRVVADSPPPPSTPICSNEAVLILFS